MKLERLDVSLEVKAADDDSGEIEGLGSVFGNVDEGGDVVEKGAFAKSLEAKQAKGDTLPMLWQHNPADVRGVWTEFEETPDGLRVKGRLMTDTTAGRDALALLRHKAIKGLSIGYVTKDAEVNKSTGVRTLKQVDPWEVSLVTFPMNAEAQVFSVKSLAEMTEREIEKGLRDVGLSAREAKTVVSRLMDLGSQRDAEEIRAAAQHEAMRQVRLDRLAAALRV